MPTNDNSTTATSAPVTGFPTSEQVRLALQAVIVDDQQPLEIGWQHVVVQLRADLETLIGIDAVAAAVDRQLDELAGERPDRDHDERPFGVHVGVGKAAGAVRGLRTEWVYRYARLAQGALRAVAEATAIDPFKPYPWSQTDAPDGAYPTPPTLVVPDVLIDRLAAAGIDPDAMNLLEDALAKVEQVEEDARLGQRDDNDSWEDRCAEYADAVAWSLVGPLRPLLVDTPVTG